MSWVALAAVPVVAAYWLRLFGRFVDGDSERDHVDALRLTLLGLALAFLLAHAFVAVAAALALQQLLALPGLPAIRTGASLLRASPGRSAAAPRRTIRP